MWVCFFFSSRRRHTRWNCDWSSDVCSSDLASLGCGLATAEGFLIAMRFLQGLGAAIVLPAALSIVMNMFPEGAERNKALGVWGAIGASGAAVGVMAGGLLTRYAVSTAPRVGWGTARTVSLLAVSATLLAAFVVIETRVEAPLMPLRIFGTKTLAGANAVGVLLGEIGRAHV